MFNLSDEVQILEDLFYINDMGEPTNIRNSCGTIVNIHATMLDGVQYNVLLNNSSATICRLDEQQLMLTKEKTMFNLGDEVRIKHFSGTRLDAKQIVGKTGTIIYMRTSMEPPHSVIVAYDVQVTEHGTYTLTEEELELVTNTQPLTITKIRQHKEQLENDILALLVSFEQETKVAIYNLTINCTTYEGYSPEQTKRILSVNIEIKL